MPPAVNRRHGGRRVGTAPNGSGAVSKYTESGIRKPRIRSLRSFMTTKLHTLFSGPGRADDVFHSLDGRIAFFESVVMEVSKVTRADAQTLLKEDFIVPAKSDGSKPTPKKLKPCLGKALNNVHYNLKEVIVQACSEATGYDGTKAAVESLFERATVYVGGDGSARGADGLLGCRRPLWGSFRQVRPS
eukprot:TRINITY_DN3765_c0_g1_i2.p2 TRINITY_DN3765_c0_g1~~TRINITY_DN3765_c0_g1_i2.p2  ORF type:complete len:188 (+),score=26.91 TRINITY_DN3765_c0_g1_i2:1436-1999(+)